MNRSVKMGKFGEILEMPFGSFGPWMGHRWAMAQNASGHYR
jgi:hypothetical protein